MEQKKPIDECTFKANITLALDLVRKKLETGDYGVDPSFLSPEAYADLEKSLKEAFEEEVKHHREVHPQTN